MRIAIVNRPYADHPEHANMPMTVALVGHPNCGKTTLFNRLTGAQQKTGNWPGVTVECYTRLCREEATIQMVDLPGLETLHATMGAAAEDTLLAQHFLSSHPVDVILNVVDVTQLASQLPLTLQLREKNVPMIVVLNDLSLMQRAMRRIDHHRLSQLLGCPVLLFNTVKAAVLTQHIARRKNGEVQETNIQTIVSQCTITDKPTIPWTKYLDNVFLHRWLGIPFFLIIMYGLFTLTIVGGSVLQDYFSRVSQWVVIEGLARILVTWHSPQWLIAFLVNGLGRGFNTIITLIPVIGILFFLLTFLEKSGYMMRAAVLTDRAMRLFGLPGRALIPMIIGLGCNVPAVMATRTLNHARDRLLTILMTPFMSCSARLTIYAAFASVFFTAHGQWVVFALYFIGIILAMLTGWLLRKTILPGETISSVMTLSAYQWPTLRYLFQQTWQRLYGFVFRAGKVIVPVCLVIEMINHVSFMALATAGQWLAPLFSPLGLTAHNWPAVIGLLTGVMAKEVVLGTLNTLYAGVYGTTISFNTILSQQFDGAIGAFAYLLFILLYFPCLSTFAVMLREMHYRWALFSAAWMMGIAYSVAVLFYQSATFLRHPISASCWIGGIILFLMIVVCIMRWVARQYANGISINFVEKSFSKINCLMCHMQCTGK